jgi:glucokinase
VAQAAPASVIAGGLAAAFNSDKTPPFAQMLSTLFHNSSDEQKAGLLNHLLASMPAGALTQALSGAGLAGLFAGKNQLSPDQAQKVSPESIQQLATHAQIANPSVVDSVSSFYAQHSTLIKTLGGTALTIALAKVAERQKQA